MKTSKPMQLRILDKMRENVESGSDLYGGIEIFDPNNSWYDIDEINYKTFKDYDVRIKLGTITINGVDIPKPLSEDDLQEIRRCAVYYPIPVRSLFNTGSSDHALINYFKGMICYPTKEEAIEASKLLFGIKDCQ